MNYCRLQWNPDGATLLLTGQWNLARVADIDAELGAAGLPSSPITLDGARLETLDTATALALLVRLATGVYLCSRDRPLEAVQPGRIVHQNLLLKRRFGRH